MHKYRRTVKFNWIEQNKPYPEIVDLNLKKLYLQIQTNAYILLEEKKKKKAQTNSKLKTEFDKKRKEKQGEIEVLTFSRASKRNFSGFSRVFYRKVQTLFFFLLFFLYLPTHSHTH